MASTDIDICNLALLRVRTAPILTLTDESNEANNCAILYPSQRDALLQRFAWGFATRTRALSRQNYTPQGWQYAYDFPNDCLQAQFLTASGYDPATMSPIPFANGLSDTDHRLLFTDIQAPVLVYTKKIIDVRLFSALFVDALAWKMAMELATGVGGEKGNKYYARAEMEFNKAIDIAMCTEANQSQTRGAALPRALAQDGMLRG